MGNNTSNLYIKAAWSAVHEALQELLRNESVTGWRQIPENVRPQALLNGWILSIEKLAKELDGVIRDWQNDTLTDEESVSKAREFVSASVSHLWPDAHRSPKIIQQTHISPEVEMMEYMTVVGELDTKLLVIAHKFQNGEPL